MVTDTAYFRNENYHTMGDRIETLDLERMARPYDPCTHADPSRKEGLLLINALFDPLVPIVVAQDLYEAWGKPDRMLLPSGHVSTVVFGPLLLARMIVHLEQRLPRG